MGSISVVTEPGKATHRNDGRDRCVLGQHLYDCRILGFTFGPATYKEMDFIR